MSSTLRQSNDLTQSNIKKTTSIASKEHKSLSTYQQQTINSSHVTENQLISISLHPAVKCIGTPNLKPQQYKKFIHLLYYGLTYCTKNLKGPTQEYLRKKAVTLPESKPFDSPVIIESKKKFLMLDLDETLIHSVFDSSLSADVKLLADGNQFRFNVRPHCLKFLQNMSEHYEIYVFTASTKDYAEPIVKYLNKKKRTIQGVLHRKNCLQTVNGFKIKDLRIIKNCGLQEIIIVDNLVHSFGLQLDNGIPIIQFIANKDDRQLLHLQKTLHRAKQHKDVREFIRDHINIRKCLQYSQKDILNLNSQKWCKKQKGNIVGQTKKQNVVNEQKTTLKNLLMCGG